MIDPKGAGPVTPAPMVAHTTGFVRRSAISWQGLFLASAAFVLHLPQPTAAQEAPSREVVQPLPPPEAEALNAALRRLGGNPEDIDALLDAGEASIALEDTDAAYGFFMRAAELEPRSGRVRAGMAAILLRDENPFDALRLFEQAEAAGVPPAAIAADRGLAYDLVGNNAAAQGQYRLALDEGEDAEVRKRLAMSLAIAGDQYGSEAILLPLLQQRDLSGYRTRAFALAALGKVDEAVAIAETVLPARIATRIAPYLRYMPRLTRAQQAAAANLGNFPRAEEIGRDDPRVAQYAQEVPPRMARGGPDTRLVPSGEPLGRPASEPQAPARGEELPAVTVTAPPPAAPSPRTAAPGSQLARMQESQEEVPLPDSGPATGTVTASAPATPPNPVGLSEAFAGFDRPASESEPAPGAVDITAIEPPRELREPPPPAHPSRIWVQVATGRDMAALAFDWRRIVRNSGGLLDEGQGFTVDWGQTNRLVTGPFETRTEALGMVNKLKEAGLDTFMFTSGEGEAVASLR